MTKREISKLFEDRKIRTVWDDKEEKWYFSIVDVVAVLTDSADPKQYIKRMKSRDEGLKANWGTICTLVPLVSEDGKKHKEMTADTTGIFRVIQSIPSPKAEPIKQWIAHVARVAREQLEAKTGRNVVSPLSAKRFFEEQRPNKEIEDGEEKEE